MGNTPSAEKASGSDKNSTSSNSPRDTSHTHDSRDQHVNKKFPRRRESVPTVPHGRSAAAPPSASLDSAQGHTTSATNHASSQAARSSHARGRSQTSVTPHSRPYEEKIRETAEPNGKQESTQEARPVNVPSHPVPTDPNVQLHTSHGQGDSPGVPSSYHIPNSQFQRPPRLPLPIEREDFAPGSPIISPADLPGPLGRDIVPQDDSAQIERKSSILSSTTIDEDEALDDFQAAGLANGQMVNTLVEWKEGGDHVYFAGSFTQWHKKHRMSRNGPSKDPNVWSGTVSLLVGAHQLAFFVDGHMRTSKYLPTAVDYTNVLVNYIEVSAEDAEDAKSAQQPLDIQRSTPEHSKQAPAAAVQTQIGPDGQQTPIHPPPAPDLKPTQGHEPVSARASHVVSPTSIQDQPQASPFRPSSVTSQHAESEIVPDPKLYHTEIPPFLRDLDAPEESHRFARASAVMQTQPTPPSLPMFLNKSILNGQLPMKDDASVLVLPNHTVLNHLATTSIKNHVLATSATTRYKRKYVTTIMHRPTSDTGT